jgi:hypothetical protein
LKGGDAHKNGELEDLQLNTDHYMNVKKLPGTYTGISCKDQKELPMGFTQSME